MSPSAPASILAFPSAHLSFRALSRADFPLLAAWLAAPHVARWWNHDTAPAAIEADFGPSVDRRDPTDMFIALLDGRPLGYVQRYTFADNPQYMEELARLLEVPGAALSMDYFVGEAALLRQGMGAAMLRAALEHLWRDYPSAPCVVVPVNSSNTASWRVLGRAGFTCAAQGPLTPDNPVDDPLHYVYRIARPGL